MRLSLGGSITPRHEQAKGNIQGERMRAPLIFSLMASETRIQRPPPREWPWRVRRRGQTYHGEDGEAGALISGEHGVDELDLVVDEVVVVLHIAADAVAGAVAYKWGGEGRDTSVIHAEDEAAVVAELLKDVVVAVGVDSHAVEEEDDALAMKGGKSACLGLVLGSPDGVAVPKALSVDEEVGGEDVVDLVHSLGYESVRIEEAGKRELEIDTSSVAGNHEPDQAVHAL